MNEGDVTTRFLQIWLTPDKRGVKPQYGSKSFEPADRHNRRTSRLHPVTVAEPDLDRLLAHGPTARLQHASHQTTNYVSFRISPDSCCELRPPTENMDQRGRINSSPISHDDEIEPVRCCMQVPKLNPSMLALTQTLLRRQVATPSGGQHSVARMGWRQ